MTCPLCNHSHISFYHQDKKRDYWQCSNCQLVFVLPEQYLSLDQEKAEYDLHDNNPSDSGYRQFLDKLLLPLSEQLPAKAKGLDFGCGPGPTISVMMAERGFAMQNYDPIYSKQPQLLEKQYDFISCTEVIEHCHQPIQEFELLHKLLKNKGLIGIMTKRVKDKAAFSNWHYKNDLTHVCFFSDTTFNYIAERWNYRLQLISADTVILEKC